MSKELKLISFIVLTITAMVTPLGEVHAAYFTGQLEYNDGTPDQSDTYYVTVKSGNTVISGPTLVSGSLGVYTIDPPNKPTVVLWFSSTPSLSTAFTNSGSIPGNLGTTTTYNPCENYAPPGFPSPFRASLEVYSDCDWQVSEPCRRRGLFRRCR
jgi:hypothetical protein